jgi:hypothetical protein
MKPSFEADKPCNPKDSLNIKKLGYFKAFARFHVVQPSLRPSTEGKAGSMKSTS